MLICFGIGQVNRRQSQRVSVLKRVTGLEIPGIFLLKKFENIELVERL